MTDENKSIQIHKWQTSEKKLRIKKTSKTSAHIAVYHDGVALGTIDKTRKNEISLIYLSEKSQIHPPPKKNKFSFC